MVIGDTGSFTDPKDGQVYQWKVMKDGKKWMVENYKFKAEHSMVYNNDEANADKYGRLYLWSEAMAACPEGWKVPNEHDWYKLVWSYNSEDWKALRLLMKGGGAGFNLQHSGTWTKEHGFSGLGDISIFLTSIESGSSQTGGVEHARVAITNCVSVAMLDGEGDQGHRFSCRFFAD